MRITAISIVSGLALTSLAAQAPTLEISIGVRETGFNGSLIGNVGGNGGTNGGIEWINRDAQTLPIDGQWHTFTFNITTDPILGFAGSTANSILEGSYGTFEHIRVLNSGGTDVPMTLFVDDVVNTTTTGGAVTIADFELLGQGTQAMFRDASFSGSTSGNLVAGSTAGIETMFATPTDVYALGLQFIDASTTRWARITTFNVANIPNPVVRFDDNSVVTFRMMAFTECGVDQGSQGPGNAIMGLCGSGLNTGEASALHAAKAPPSSFGAAIVSFNGFPDLPTFGGNVVSGTGFLFTIPMFTDASGYAGIPLTGDSLLIDFALQGVFLDLSQPMGVGFSNSVIAAFGQ